MEVNLHSEKSLIKYATIALFLGWAFIHLFFDPSYRAFFWNEDWLREFIEQRMHLNWEVYVSDRNIEIIINRLQYFIGFFQLLCVGACLSFKRWPRLNTVILILGTISILWVGFLKYVDSSFQVVELCEFALQVTTPLLFCMLHTEKIRKPNILLFMKVAISLTFISHGLYAIGYLPVPGHFIDMTINVLGVNEVQARA